MSRIAGVNPETRSDTLVTDVGGLARPVIVQGIDALRVGRLQHASVEFTSRCNLRCVYCAVSQPDYVGQDLELATCQEVLRSLKGLGLPSLALNGHGESLMRGDWAQFAELALREGFRTQITTNLSRHLEDEELTVLSRFRVIRVSLDTSDPGLLRRIRRKVDLGVILSNIFRIRARARTLEIEAPAFSASCGVFGQNGRSLPELAQLLVECGFRTVNFWNFVPYERLSDAENAVPLSELPVEEAEVVLSALRRAGEILTSNGVEVTIAGDLAQASTKRRKPPRDAEMER